MVGIILAYKQVNKLSPGGWSRGLFLSAREENAAKKELEHLGFVEVVYMAKHEFGIMLDALRKASIMTNMNRGNIPAFLLMMTT